MNGEVNNREITRQAFFFLFFGIKNYLYHYHNFAPTMPFSALTHNILYG